MGIVSVARYVVVLDYKPDSGSVNGDKDGRHIPLTALSSGRRVSRVLPTAFVPEVVAMVFHRREIQTERRRQARSLFPVRPSPIISRNSFHVLSSSV